MSVGTAGAIQAPPPQAGVLGQGIKYPPALDTARGRLSLSWGADLVAQSIQSIALTQPLERSMQLDYGAGAATFEPIDLARLKVYLDQQIAAHEPRAQNVRVEIAPPTTGGIAMASISYSVIGEATVRTLTLPLYTPPSLIGPSQ